MGSIKLNSIYMCNDMEKIELYREKLYKAIQNKTEYPDESDLPPIYIEGNREINLNGYFDEPYYKEIEVGLIASTNTSQCGTVYSNYIRVTKSIPYILNDNCKPIAVLREGDKYYIENGKHRFLAYTLLGAKTIPVSIREKISCKQEILHNAIEFKRGLYSDDGNSISYPEHVINFYNENRELFRDINRIKMKCLEINKKYQLSLIKSNGDVIEINNGISAGSEYRSSKMTKEIITNCGFDIDMNFIKEHSEFFLEDKYDAHNILFDINITFEKKDRKNILEKVGNIEYFPFTVEEKNNKIFKLHSFLSSYHKFETKGTHITTYNSGMVNVNEKVYYFVGSDCIKNGENYVYIFSDDKFQKSNLNIRYLGRISKSDGLYRKISTVK